MSADNNTTAIAIAVVRNGDRYLIGRRAAGGPLADYWEFPGGKIRANETPAVAAVRECHEETGLAVRVGELLADIEHSYPYGRLRLYFFSCALEGTETVPATPFRWVAARELANYPFPEANREIIAQLAGQ